MAVKRTKRGEPVEDTIAALTVSQRRMLEKIRQARASEPVRLRRESMVAKGLIRDAMEAGVPMKALMAELGLGRARIYQIRDEADTYDKADQPGSPELSRLN